MNFQDLKKVETGQFYLDVAFRGAIKRLDAARSSIRIRTNKVEKVRRLEHLRVNVIRDKLDVCLERIIRGFPSLDALPEFYVELIKCSMDYQKIKKALSTINWAKQKIDELAKKTLVVINGATTQTAINKARKSFSGRVSSVMKRANKDLLFLEKTRKEMKDFPALKTSLSTVAITGFPNVGKSTLLKKLTGANPQIKNYAFTTKNLNLGYTTIGEERVQFVDTPGSLNRYAKMNPIEKKSYLVMKYLADLVVFVFDLTETYSLEDQTALFHRIQEFDKPIVLFASKTDLLDPEQIKEFCASCNAQDNLDDLRKAIEKEINTLF